MSDLLVELGQHPTARNLIRRFNLPVPLPVRLERTTTPWTERELDDRRVAVAAGARATLGATLADGLASAGASPTLISVTDAYAAAFDAPGEAWGRPAWRADAPPDERALHGIVCDATGLTEPRGLRLLYDVFHRWLPALRTCGRVVVLVRPSAEATTAAGHAAIHAVDGFVRSLAKELGRRGATANLVSVASGAEARVAPLLRFLLSSRAAYITGQPFAVSGDVFTDAAVTDARTRPLAGQVALVTGAARGIGAVTARRLAAEGAHVVCLDRPADDGPASKIARAIGGSVALVDVSVRNAPQLISEQLLRAHGGVDIVVHNAGVTRDKTLAKMDADRWDQAVGINLTAVVDITERLCDGVLRDGGRVVCLSSIAGIAGNFGQTNYAASKAGIIGYVRALGQRLATRGVAVNGIAPGFIETRLTAAMPAVTREVARRMAVLSQAGLPADIAELATFLASPGAAGLSGQTIRACGGNLVGA